MRPLTTPLRRQLEKVIADAREAAEAGARAALQTLAVHEPNAYPHMDQKKRALRRGLRAHARQLGDPRDRRSGEQSMERLAHECAYERWHSMLFARFLAENHLLVEPELGAITLDECEELARDLGTDKWAMAVGCAHGMLPGVFRADHPAFSVPFAREHRLRMEALLESLSAEVFVATDALGWVYQFWQSKRKNEVNRSEVKVGADELPAVTQLFTEPYMVAFLLDNGLGAWWAARRLTDTDFMQAETETELRRRASIDGVPLDYLRFVRAEKGETTGAGWRIAAGDLDAWPDRLAELRILDPCCGSGHFLVAAFNMLVPVRMTLEDLTAREAVDAVLRDNLHGLELDARCVEIAAFALALAAWTYPGAEGYRSLPTLKLACSGLSVGATRERWTELAPSGERNLRTAFGWLHDAFRDAPVLGSLLDPSETEAAQVADWQSLAAVLRYALTSEARGEHHEAAVAAQGMAKAGELLTGRYHWVVTNVPYLARGRQDNALRDFCEKRYPLAKRDLATVFLERCLTMCREGGVASLVLPQNWLFLTTYRELREKLLSTARWRLLARLGPGAFETITGEVVKAALLTISPDRTVEHAGALFGHDAASDVMHGLDVSASRAVPEKAIGLRNATLTGTQRARQLDNPDARVLIGELSTGDTLDRYCVSIEGLTTGDLGRFVTKFWEGMPSDAWDPYIQNTDATTLFAGRTDRVLWQNGQGALSRFPKAHNFPSHVMNGKRVLGRKGLRVTQMGELPVTVYTGEVFGKNAATVVPDDPKHLPAIWCFCSSPEYNEAVRRIDQKLNVTNATLAKVPFDLERWAAVARDQYPNGLPQPYTNDPTQWIFHGHPCGSVVWDETDKCTRHGAVRVDATVLQVAVARLLGYRWPAESDTAMELAEEQRAWVGRCPTLLAQADEDGIVCIPAIRGEPSANERLLDMLAAAYGEAWNDDTSARLLAAGGASTFGEWLRNRFFDEHCKLFHHRPFVWHVWDGRRRDGFHALVNYHKLAEGNVAGQRLLNSLTYSHLGDWISRQREGVQRGEAGAEERLAAALELQRRLVAILEGEPPYDLCVRWKPLGEQPIGWQPDINDGVRINIRPFLANDIPGGRKGAGVLRVRPNIHWKKDRGKEPFQERDSFPWFWSEGEFTGDRVNDVHLAVAEKRAARRQQEDAA